MSIIIIILHSFLRRREMKKELIKLESSIEIGDDYYVIPTTVVVVLIEIFSFYLSVFKSKLLQTRI